MSKADGVMQMSDEHQLLFALAVVPAENVDGRAGYGYRLIFKTPLVPYERARRLNTITSVTRVRV